MVAQSIGRRLLLVFAFPIAVVAAVITGLFKGEGKIVFATCGLVIAIWANLNSYWVQFFDRPSLVPVPGLFDTYLNVGEYWTVLLRFDFWVSFFITGVSTVLQSPAISSEDPESLIEKYQFYKNIAVPSDVDWDKHVTMTKVTAESIKGIDQKAHQSNLALTIGSWFVEISITIMGMKTIVGFIPFVQALIYSVITSITPELMAGQVLTLFRQQQRTEKRRQERRG